MVGGEFHADKVIGNLARWARERDLVRAMLLTSTRAVPGATVDAWSDYDVILVVRDIDPFVADRSWIETFGRVLVAWWDPVEPDPDTGIDTSGNIVEYEGRLKIDFSLWPLEHLSRIIAAPALPAELDAGYRVLLDKDDLTVGMAAPTYTAYIPARPDEAAYLETLTGFFVGVPYVAKCLLRDELLPARWCLDVDMRDEYLRPMLEWWVECHHEWSVPTGAKGKGLKRRLPPDFWAELEATYAGAGIADTWTSLFRLVALFRRVARDVALCLGYEYPDDLDRRVTDHARRMHAGGLR